MTLSAATITADQLAKTVDFALLRADATAADFQAHCRTAADYGFAIVAINPEPVAICREFLTGTGVGVGAAIGFPLGSTTVAQKVAETELALADGADEIDYVVNLRAVKEGNWALVRTEMRAMVDASRGHVCKVIIETGLLSDDEKRAVAQVAADVRPTFVKTCTGMGPGVATVADVALLRSLLPADVGVKASSGIKTLDDALALIDAGATRLGTSAGPAIVDTFIAGAR